MPRFPKNASRSVLSSSPVLATLLAAGANSSSLAQSYTFAKLVDSTQIPYTSGSIGEPNAYGTVVFTIDSPLAQRGVYLSTGFGAPIKVIDGSAGQYTGFGKPDLNCHNDVVVRAHLANGKQRIVTYDGGASYELEPLDGYYGDPTINDHGQTFWVVANAPFGSPSNSFFVEGSDLPACSGCLFNLPVAAGPSGSPKSLHPVSDINNAGVFAYGATNAAGMDEIRVHATSGPGCGLVETLAAFDFNLNNSSIVINGQSRIGFFAGSDFWFDECGFGPKAKIVQNTSGIAYATLDLNWWYAPCYRAQTPAKIFGGAFQTNPILGVGDSLALFPGATVTDIWCGGINNRGSVSIAVNLSTGQRAFLRADPIFMTAEPEGCPQLAPFNDLWSDALAIGPGSHDFSNYFATTDGPPLDPACDEGYGLSFENDVWFAFTSPTQKRHVASTCNAADFDTRLAVYLPGPDGSPETLLACNDDAEGCGLTSETSTFTAEAGQTYLVRVGAYSGWGSGVLTMAIKCEPDLNGDGTVNGADLGLFLAAFGTSLSTADFNGDGVVDGADLGQLLADWD